MNPFERKSIFLWDSPTVGDPARIVTLLRAAGFEGVYLHSASLSKWRQLHSQNLINALKAAGIAVVGSVAVYGDDPVAEGTICANLCREYDLAGWVYDIEGTYERKTNAVDNTKRMLSAFRALLPGLPLAWCSWAYFYSPFGAQWHPVSVVKAALDYVDYGMPMTYWTNGETPDHAVSYLDGSLKQWRGLTEKPLIPVGRAYNGDTKNARADAVRAFAQRVIAAGCPGVSWWSLQHAVQLPAIWQALTDTPGMAKGAPGQESQLDRIERKLDKLLEMVEP